MGSRVPLMARYGTESLAGVALGAGVVKSAVAFRQPVTIHPSQYSTMPMLSLAMDAHARLVVP